MYKTPTVPSPATVITQSLRFHGQVHTPPQADLASVMNHPRPFFPITECSIYKLGLEHPPAQELRMTSSDFLILPKENVLWIAEPETVDLEVRRSYRNLYVLFNQYVLKGEVNIPTNVRLSDFLTRSVAEKPFHYLYRVEVRRPDPSKSLPESNIVSRLEAALVNLRNVVGFYDVSEDSSKPDLSGFLR